MVVNQTQVVILEDELPESLVQKFYDQALRPTFNMAPVDLIQERALRRIKACLMGKWELAGLPSGCDKIWPNIMVNGEMVPQDLVTIAEQIKTLFGTSNRAETVLDCDRRLREVSFTFSYANDQLEQNFYINFTDIIVDFYRMNPDLLTPSRNNDIAKIFVANLPKDHEITRLFTIATKAYVATQVNKFDDYESAYRRFVDLMTAARTIFKSCSAYGPFDKQYKKDSTFDQHEMSKNKAAKLTLTVQGKATNNSKTVCDCCGIFGHSRDTCKNSANPDCNLTTRPWKDSPVGIQQVTTGLNRMLL